MNSAHKTKKSLGEKMTSKFLSRDTDGAIPMVNKKANKPLTEKRRRDRINKCLVQLKNIVMRATGKDEKKFPKMEKADILEMTIGHLIELHQQNIGQRYANHMHHATPENLESYRSMHRNNDTCMNSLQGRVSDKDYLFPVPPSPTPYKCGYSGAIMDVNFDQDDVLERDGILCGSASRVFIFANDDSQNIHPSRGTPEKKGMKNTVHRLPDEGSFYRRINMQKSGQVFTSTPLCNSPSKPVLTSTPLRLPSLTKDVLVSPDDMSVAKRYNINLNTSPEMRMQLFTSSDDSSFDQVRSMYSSTSSSSESSTDGVWRPW